MRKVLSLFISALPTHLRTGLYISVLTILFVSADTLIDRIFGPMPGIGTAQVVFAVVIICVSFFLLRRATLNRHKAEEILNQSRSELEVKIQTRTLELEASNHALRQEIAERKQAQQERENSFQELNRAHKQTEKLAGELRMANNMLETLIETLPAGMLLIDAVGEVLLANSMARSILSHNPLEDSYSLRVDPMICYVDDSALPAEQIPLNHAILKGETTTGYEVSIDSDGQSRVMLIAATPLYDEQGKIISAVEIIQDITATKKMEKELREKEERYRALFDNFSEPATVWNQDGILLMENLISARNLGGTPDDFIGKSIFDIFGELAPGYMERINRVIQTGKIEFQEDAIESKSGKHYYWTSMQRVPFQGSEYAAQSISYDITDRKLAEEALRTSEEKFATVYHFSPDAIAIIRNDDGCIFDVNDAFSRLLGYSRPMVLGKKWRDLLLLPSKTVPDEMVSAFRERRKLSDYELDLTASNGDRATVLLSVIPINIDGNQFYLAIAHDITKRKRSEDALRKIQAELARGVQHRIAMEERQRLARDLHDSVSQAIYGISLGANTALTLMDTDRKRTIEALHYVVSLAQAGLTEMRALIFELRPESLQNEGLVAALTRQTAAMRVRYEMTVETHFCAEPDIPLSLKEALYRIGQEALQNTIKHARAQHVQVDLTRDEQAIMLDIRDQGIGFDPLGVFPGHLGLHSMRERAVNAGGILEIISKVGEGTHVHVRISTPSQAPAATDDLLLTQPKPVLSGQTTVE